MVKESLTKMFGFSQNENRNEYIHEINIKDIKPNPYQPRKFFDPIQMDDLAKSIKEFGIIQPLIVRQKGSYYEIIAGERRMRAAQIIGMKSVPAIIRNAEEKEMAEMALIENLQREDLNYFEEAEGYKRLIEEFSLTQEEIARRVGKSQSTIANKIRLLKLPENVKKNIVIEIITERHARALLKLPEEEMQLKALKEIYERELNVRETDILVEKILSAYEDRQKGKGKKIVRIFKDIRIYLNAIKSAVSEIENAGLDVKVSENDYDDYVQVVIQISKKKKSV
ncbi:MAG: nucleoid occlusion protein [Peptococcaceae bacterium]|nr:nucleoid occlusion protein [Peptococcaceae bacterium]MDH7523817.1 nucleoid occlusion protein [Peptococcaceae bacterium]